MDRLLRLARLYGPDFFFGVSIALPFLLISWLIG